MVNINFKLNIFNFNKFIILVLIIKGQYNDSPF